MGRLLIPFSIDKNFVNKDTENDKRSCYYSVLIC